MVNQKTLYALQIERFNGFEWVAQPLVYAHALDPIQAKLGYLGTMKGQPIRVVHVGRVVGYHVEDKQGKVLST